MGASHSARHNGWSSYPATVWNQQRSPDRLGDLPFWAYCAAKHGGPILDICCGNGRIAIPLAAMGHDVVGADLNAQFLCAARDRVSALADQGQALSVSFVAADIACLPLGQRFRLAIMPDWSFQVLLTQEDQISFLACLHNALLRGGAFAFNLFMPHNRQRGLARTEDGYAWPPNPDYHDGAPRTYDPVTQIETFVESNIHPIELRHTTLAELELLFRITGFDLAELYGDVDRRPFAGASDDDYTIVARAV